MEQLEQKQILPMEKCTGRQQKSPKLLNRKMEEQSTHFICITHQGKHNGSVLLTNERYTEQLEQTQTLVWTTHAKKMS